MENFGTQKSNQPDTLFFKTETDGHPLGYSYITIAKDQVKIRPGDHLEYDIFIDLISPLSQAGVDLHCISGRAMRDSMVIDQNGMWSHPLTNLHDAVDNWYHRKMDLTNLVNETIESVEIAFVAPIAGTYIACFKNIVLTNHGAIVHSFYSCGEPKVIESKIKLAYSNDVVCAIQWSDFRKVKLDYIDPIKLSPAIVLAERLMSLETTKKGEWQKLIERAKNILDIPKYVVHDDDGFKKSHVEVAKILAPILREARTFTIHVIGHAHIDMNWLWVWDETLAVCHRDFETMATLMQKYPFFTFSQSQVAIYKAIMKTRPDLFERIRYFVNRDQWEITAAMWVEGDENMAAGEAIVRQFLLANRFLRKHFGKQPVVCWQPDLFGHVWTMPQILKKCGVKYYYFMRCGKDNPQVFWWQGLDGSKLLAATTPNYNGSIGHDTINYVFELFRKQGLKDYMHVYGVGDHGGGPTIRDIQRGLELGNTPYLPALKFSTVESYFDTIVSNGENLPIINDELQFIFEGCYTTHADIKLRNRQCENLFPVLEMFSVFALPYELPYPKFILDEGWERTCFNQFHDILPGSAIHSTYEEAIPITDGFIAAGKQALQKSLATIANQVRTKDMITNPIVVFNPSNWERHDVVTVTLPMFQDEWAEIVDHTGRPVPCQITHRTAADAEVIFIAKNIPSLGYKTYGWRKRNDPPEYETELFLSPDLRIENKFYQIAIDKKTGCIQNLVLKADSKELIEPGKKANLLQLLHEQGQEMSAWQIGKILATEDLIHPDRIDVLEKGPVRVTLQIVHKNGESTFIQQIAIYHDLTRIDFPCTVDWQEIGNREKGSKFLKVAFPLNLNNSHATFEIPYGHIQREANGHEYPSQKWLDVSDSEYGVTLMNDCKYGCDVNKNVMRLSLLRASYEPDPIPDKGLHHFKYSILPHRGDWKAAQSLREGYALNQPLLPILTTHHDGSLDLSQSFVACSGDNIIITALKKSEDDDSLILRCYETEGKKSRVEFNFLFQILKVIETDLIERELTNSSLKIENNSFSVIIDAYEIKSFKLTREPIKWPKHHNFIPV